MLKWRDNLNYDCLKLFYHRQMSFQFHCNDLFIWGAKNVFKFNWIWAYLSVISKLSMHITYVVVTCEFFFCGCGKKSNIVVYKKLFLETMPSLDPITYSVSNSPYWLGGPRCLLVSLNGWFPLIYVLWIQISNKFVQKSMPIPVQRRILFTKVISNKIWTFKQRQSENDSLKQFHCLWIRCWT